MAHAEEPHDLAASVSERATSTTPLTADAPGHPEQRGRSPSEEGEERDTGPPLPDEEPPLPDEEPPLPDEVAPLEEDDGWEARWDASLNAYYFFNRFTHKSQWENPRVPDASQAGVAPGTESRGDAGKQATPEEPYQGYNPKIHGDYDPNADYAKFHKEPETEQEEDSVTQEAGDAYAQAATFNRFTGSFQSQDRGADYHNDESKSKRQMSAFFDVDKAANTHDGRSLKAERAQRKLSKREVREFNEKRKAKKDQKRREFLMS